MKKSYPLRIEDELYLKIQFIANAHSRSLNKEFEFLLKQYTSEFEKKEGIIPINVDNLYQ